MKKEELERQADMIESVLYRNQIKAQVTGGTVTPRFVQFALTPGAKPDRVEALAATIARSVGALRAQVVREGDAVKIVIPRADAKPVSLADMLKRIKPAKTPIPPATALLGMADDGAPLLARLTSPIVGHMLIEGGPHTGKTSLIRTALLSLSHYNSPESLRLLLIGRELGNLDRLPHVWHRGLNDLAALIDRRHAEGNIKSSIVVAIDDFDGLDPEAIGDLITRGPAVNVYFIGATRAATDRPEQWPSLITAKQDADAGEFVITPFTGPTMSFVAAYATPTEVDDLLREAQK